MTQDAELRGNYGPGRCPVCGSVGARALMMDHIELAHPGGLVTKSDLRKIEDDLAEARSLYRQLQELTGSALYKAHSARGDSETSEAKLAEHLAILKAAIQIHLDTFGYDNREGLADALVAIEETMP